MSHAVALTGLLHAAAFIDGGALKLRDASLIATCRMDRLVRARANDRRFEFLPALLAEGGTSASVARHVRVAPMLRPARVGAFPKFIAAADDPDAGG